MPLRADNNTPAAPQPSVATNDAVIVIIQYVTRMLDPIANPQLVDELWVQSTLRRVQVLINDHCRLLRIGDKLRNTVELARLHVVKRRLLDFELGMRAAAAGRGARAI